VSRALRLALAAVTLTAVTFLAPLPAGACSCVVRDLAAQVQAASSVFVGTVRAVSDSRVTFSVDRLYKGTASPRATVADPATSCAVPFVVGRTYLVFTSSPAGALTTDICSGTTDDLLVASRLSVSAGLASTTPLPATPAWPRARRVASRAVPIAVAAALAALLGVVTTIAARNLARPRTVS
jgi:hypothetical protein